jgi:hypothetical protein
MRQMIHMMPGMRVGGRQVVHLSLFDRDAEWDGHCVTLDRKVASDLDVEDNFPCLILHCLETQVVDVRVREVVPGGGHTDVDLARKVGQIGTTLAVVGDEVLKATYSITA